ncbi:MAG: hypothetical protein M3174_02190, partial [Actinomycetota bacterium]|nr:hypothetical protein [Actinomycetota bacterium]
LLVGLVAGLIVGSEDPDPVEAVREVRVTLTEAASLLEIVEIEYAEALEDGSGAGDQEYEGALDALARSRSHWRRARPALALLESDDASAIDARYEELQQAMESEALPEEINQLTAELSQMLDPETD